MFKVKILINSINKVREFVELCCDYPFDIDIVSGRYTIDAKSLMGVFTLDLSKVLEICVHTDVEDAKEFTEKLNKYKV